MSISDLALALGKDGDEVERSTLSRYVNKHGLARGRRGRSVLCSFSEVKAHRSGNYQRELMGGAVLDQSSSEPSSPPDGAALVVSDPLAEDAAPPTKAPAHPPTNDPHRREKQAKALLAEMDLRERMGLVVDRAEVEAGVAAAVSRFNRVSDQAAVDLAEKLMSELGLPTRHAPAVKLAFRNLARAMKSELTTQCREISPTLGEGEEVKTDARERFDQLVAKAKRLMPNPLTHAQMSAE